MDYEFRVIVEKVSVTSQKVIERDTIKVYDIKPPESILDGSLVLHVISFANAKSKLINDYENFQSYKSHILGA